MYNAELSGKGGSLFFSQHKGRVAVRVTDLEAGNITGAKIKAALSACNGFVNTSFIDRKSVV